MLVSLEGTRSCSNCVTSIDFYHKSKFVGPVVTYGNNREQCTFRVIIVENKSSLLVHLGPYRIYMHSALPRRPTANVESLF